MKYNKTTLVRKVRTLVAFSKLTTITLDKVYFYTLKVLLLVKNDNKLAFITHSNDQWIYGIIYSVNMMKSLTPQSICVLEV